MTSTAHQLVRPGTLRVAVAASSALLLATACAGSTDSVGSAAAEAPTSTPVSPPTAPPTSPAERPPVIDGLELIVTDEAATLVAVVADDDLTRIEVDWGDGEVETLDGTTPVVRLDHRYEAGGTYVVSVGAIDATGGNAVKTATANVAETAPATTPDTTLDTTAPPATTEPAPTTTRPPAPPTTTTPPTTSPTTTAPPTTTTLPPPEPIEIDLMAQTHYDGTGSAPDGAGGSGTAQPLASNEFGVRSEAHHGYNGRGTAQGSLSATIDARPLLATLPDSVTGFEVTVDWAANASGALKHPWDRTAEIRVTSSIARFTVDNVYIDGETDELIAQYREGDDDRPTSAPDFDGGGTFTTTLLSDTPIVEFELFASCTSTSGPMAFALLNEGYCDYLDQGSIELTGLSATLTPIVGTAGE